MKTQLFSLMTVAVLFLCSVSSGDAITWTTIDYPVWGIDGSNIVAPDGIYNLDTQTWTTLKYPGAINTYLYDIDGDNIAGMYHENTSGDHGFVYNLDTQTWTTLDFPGTSWTISGISGSNIVGSAGGHGVIYNLDSQVWATIDYPGAISTNISDIDGSNIVGGYYDASGDHNFLYDGTIWMTLDLPGGITGITGISGSNIVTQGGGLYNLITQSRTGIHFPGASITAVFGIDGNNIIGMYSGLDGKHGFIAEISPEPATIALFAIGACLLRRR